MPRSPVGRTSVRWRAKIRNMWTVHTPTPLTCVRRRMTSSSGRAARSSKTTLPSRVWRAGARGEGGFWGGGPRARTREGGEILEDHSPIAGVAGEVADVGGLLGGEPQRAHAGGAEFEDGFWGDYALDGGGEPAEDHTGDASAELLEDDRLDQGLKIRRAELDAIIAYLFDNGGEHRVVGAEVVDGLLHDETRTQRGASTLLYRDANTYTCRAYCGQRTDSKT